MALIDSGATHSFVYRGIGEEARIEDTIMYF